VHIRLAATGFVALVTAATLAPVAPAARSHVFEATYVGHGSGQSSGGHASGRGSATGSGNVIGRSTLSGTGAGPITSPACLSFDGTAVMRGSAGAIRVATKGAQACVPTTGGNVSFSGRASVTRGTARFAGARGTLTFHGVYDAQTQSITITFRGRVSY